MLDLSKFEQGDLEDAVAITCLVTIKRITTEYLEKSDGRNPGRFLGNIKELLEQYESLFINEEKVD